MSLALHRRLANKLILFRGSGYSVSLLRGANPLSASERRQTFSENERGEVNAESFNTSLLEFLVCPLSKKQLRYDVKNNELVNDELCIAYPIIDGIPNMIPQDARLIQKNQETSAPVDCPKA